MSYNRSIMMGRLTRDPDLRQIPSGTDICEFGIAVDSGWGDNKKTCFIDIVVWGKQAVFVNEHFSKGDGIHIEGRLELDTWEDKNGGGKRSKHKICAEKITFPVGVPVDNRTPERSAKKEEAPSGWNKNQDIDEIPF